MILTAYNKQLNQLHVHVKPTNIPFKAVNHSKPITSNHFNLIRHISFSYYFMRSN
ncbi:hypothetical protein Hanom_Chr06g00513731 [Helianthus anomalus]